MFDRFDDRTLEVATVIVVVVIALVILCYLAIYINPNIFFNPFPPDTPTPVVTEVVSVGGPTWTPSPTPEDTDTPTPTSTWTPTATPTNTPTPTATNTPVPPTATATNTPVPPTATKKPRPPKPTATPTPLPYYWFGPTETGPAGGRPDCESTWVHGYVLDANGLPEPNVQMRVGNDGGWSDYTYTDVNGEYVYQFAQGPIAGSFYVQVYKDGVPSSDPYPWYTNAGCESTWSIQEFQVDWRHR